MFPNTSKIGNDTPGFLHTWDQGGDIPRTHCRIDRRINPALGHQCVLDAVTDETKLARPQNQTAELAARPR